MMKTYRADIDGLRAVAVVSVMLFHAHLPPFGGGFVGVDVFFVISGYLITSIIHREMAAGAFSLADFYDRRVRRIFPALYVMLAATTLAAAVILIPTEYERFSKSLQPAVLFYANIYFDRSISYFGLDGASVPLLHLWSLAVEEQFYILFPLILYLLVRVRRRGVVAGGLVALFVASLVVSELLLAQHPQSAFYLLPSRAFELLMGAFLAVARLPAAPARAAAALGAAGLALIGVPVVAYSGATAFPGVAALAPCLGSALVIHSGAFAPAGPAARLLSLAPVVYVGRISYSLYLWHWPVLVMAKLYLGRDLAAPEALAGLAASVALAALSLRFVEAPFRRPQALGGRRTLRLGAGLLAMAAVLALTPLSIVGNRLLWPLSPLALKADAARLDRSRFQAACEAGLGLSGVALPPAAACALGPRAAEGPYDVLVWGDSHAAALFTGIGETAADLGLTARLVMANGCPPLVGGQPRRDTLGASDLACKPFNDAVLAEIRRQPPRLVVLVARWAMWTSHGEQGRFMTSPDLADGEALSRATSRRVTWDLLALTVRAVRATGARVLLVGQGPEYPRPPAQCVIEAELASGELASCLAVPRGRAMALVAEPDRALLALARAVPGVSTFLVSDVLCRGATCLTGRDGAFFYSDPDHLSVTGARFVAREGGLRAVLEAALGAPRDGE